MFGHCKHCWFWKLGYCYMHNNPTKETSYCPDYANRRKYNKENGQTLEEWIEASGIQKHIYVEVG